MYNVEFLPQLEESRRRLGTPLSDRDKIYAKYLPPSSLKIVPCHEDADGELVPDSVQSNNAGTGKEKHGGGE